MRSFWLFLIKLSSCSHYYIKRQLQCKRRRQGFRIMVCQSQFWKHTRIFYVKYFSLWASCEMVSYHVNMLRTINWNNNTSVYFHIKPRLQKLKTNINERIFKVLQILMGKSLIQILHFVLLSCRNFNIFLLILDSQIFIKCWLLKVLWLRSLRFRWVHFGWIFSDGTNLSQGAKSRQLKQWLKFYKKDIFQV
jgi:hypothetical protein